MSLEASVIVPVYKQPQGVRHTLESLQAQTGAGSFEVIVVDNDSPDDTGQAAERALDELALEGRVVREERKGSYAARNRGIEEAGGDVLAFTDADCRPEPAWLIAGLERVENGASRVTGPIRLTYRKHRPNAYEFYDARRNLLQHRYAAHGWAATANLIVCRAALDEVGPFDESLQSGGDLEIGMRFQQAGHRVLWDERAVVWHPARSTLRQLKQKIERVKEGRERIDANFADPPRLCGDYPTPPERELRPDVFEMVRFLIIRRKLDTLKRR